MPTAKRPPQGPRFTGTMPTPDAMREYPNWVHALDEEDVAGQDESTFRPADQQRWINKKVEYTAATALYPDGKRLARLLRGRRSDFQQLTIIDRT